MNDKISTTSTPGPKQQVAKLSTFYTFKGWQDVIDFDGYPVQYEENEKTLAKETGIRYLVRLDRKSELYNPNGLFADLSDLEPKKKKNSQQFAEFKIDKSPEKDTPRNVQDSKWIPVSKECFWNYVNFLKTKKELYYNDAVRLLR